MSVKMTNNLLNSSPSPTTSYGSRKLAHGHRSHGSLLPRLTALGTLYDLVKPAQPTSHENTPQNAVQSSRRGATPFLTRPHSPPTFSVMECASHLAARYCKAVSRIAFITHHPVHFMTRSANEASANNALTREMALYEACPVLVSCSSKSRPVKPVAIFPEIQQPCRNVNGRRQSIVPHGDC